MKLAKFVDAAGTPAVGCVDGDQIQPLRLAGSPFHSLADILSAESPVEAVRGLPRWAAEPLAAVRLLPPIDRQEVWAAGVTYKRSKAARMEESETAASCYDRVYVSPRPELFLKATPHRVSGTGQPLRIRADATWNVPEPELTLVINPRGALVACTIGNDMSSRDIEGDNPLYLPQAKVYNQCAGLGPWLTLAEAMPPRDQIGIRLQIERGGRTVFSGDTSVAQMARGFEELIGWLLRDNSFPDGAFLMTGTGVVPESSFTLQPGDVVSIEIDGIGRLVNPIVQNPAA